jgi:hypothetical protein
MVRSERESTNEIARFEGLKRPIPAISNASASEKQAPAQSPRGLFTDDCVALLFGLHYLGGVLEPTLPWAGWVARILSYVGVVAALIAFLMNYLKIAPSLPGYGLVKRLAALHLAPPKHKFYDTR